MTFLCLLCLLAALSVAAHSTVTSPRSGPFQRDTPAAAPSSASSSSPHVRSTWAVLAASSADWINYRHQADVMHAYNSLLAAGVSRDHVIVMMFNDTASHPNNKHPGHVYNELGGPDLFPTIRDHMDYVKYDLRATNWFSVLTGQPTTAGTRRVLKSGPNDDVFVYFDDHGGDDLLAWAVGADVKGEQFVKTLWEMHDAKMYGRLVVYVSACFSGSLFWKAKLPPNCYVATAAPVAASGIAVNYDAANDVYLASGWPFAVWSHNDAYGRWSAATFQDQFDWTTWHVQNTSIPCQYGDLTLAAKTTLAEFWAGPRSEMARQEAAKPARAEQKEWVYDWDIPFATAKRRHARLMTSETKSTLAREVAFREAVDRAADEVVLAGRNGRQIYPACTTCDPSVCICMKACLYDHPQKQCSFECCNIDACYKPWNVPEELALRSESCANSLSLAWRSSCAPSGTASVDLHPYLKRAQSEFHRACRSLDFDLSSALVAIPRICPAVSKLHYLP